MADGDLRGTWRKHERFASVSNALYVTWDKVDRVVPTARRMAHAAQLAKGQDTPAWVSKMLHVGEGAFCLGKNYLRIDQSGAVDQAWLWRSMDDQAGVDCITLSALTEAKRLSLGLAPGKILLVRASTDFTDVLDEERATCGTREENTEGAIKHGLPLGDPEMYKDLLQVDAGGCNAFEAALEADGYLFPGGMSLVAIRGSTRRYRCCSTADVKLGPCDAKAPYKTPLPAAPAGRK